MLGLAECLFVCKRRKEKSEKNDFNIKFDDGFRFK